MIIIVFGLPGSGKSYFAEKLSRKLQARYVNSDVIRKQTSAVRKYALEEKMKVYDEMIKEMKEAILDNTSIVLDATFYKISIRNKFMEAAQEFKRRILFIEVWADQKIIVERLKSKRLFSDADFSIHLKVKEVYEAMEEDHLVLQSTQENIDKMMNKAFKTIQKINEEGPDQ